MQNTAKQEPVTLNEDTEVSSSLAMDEFGRTEDERTVVLESEQAEAINHEVNAGGHDSYADAVAYVITRGLAEIERQRKAADALREKSKLKATRDVYSKMLEMNPALVADGNFVQKMLAELGVARNGK
jgi:ribosomal protein S9